MEIVREEYIFDGPQPFDQCHASTLLLLPGGEILAAWFGGTREGADDVNIWLSRRGEGGWSQPTCVSHDPGLPHWNPVLDLGADGRICLYYKVGRQIPYWRTMVTVSRDGGRTWTAPRELVPGDEGAVARSRTSLSIRCPALSWLLLPSSRAPGGRSSTFPMTAKAGKSGRSPAMWV